MPRASRSKGAALLLTTLSADGFPHHAFLSEDECAARGERMAVSIGATSRTAENLERRRRATLLSLDPKALRTTWLFRRARARRLLSDGARRLFLLDVVRREEARTLPGERATVRGGLFYDRRESAEEARRRRAAEEELRG